eukprot:NODE_6021_length_615_cov_7.803887_g5618_i0.p2 GENE.NODE_6021_length_615_cov_7.803887_g5618_i0~~NODE_6021_length_615_cov_7.803887_g5618_i0.p2  ORF type:complete len:109 (+),score=29.33 NODE_6021_length_615_cov_7.803887_g5618_i0:184-510(+)
MSLNFEGVQPGKLALKGQPLKTVGRKAKKRKAEEMSVAVVPPQEEKPKAVEKDTRTAAEKAYDEVQARRAEERYKAAADRSFRDRIDEYNEKISRLTEHHDIPRVGPG